MHEKDAGGRLPGLIALRFTCAFYIALVHIVPYFLPGAYVGSQGTLGISVFFILSGFVLAHGYARLPKLDRRRFFWSRFGRIYPVYLLGLVIAAPLFLAASFAAGVPRGQLAGSMSACILLVQSWYAPIAHAWNAPAWSLSTEALFYALFPLLLPILARASRRRLVWIAASMWALALIPPLAVALVSPSLEMAAITFPLARLPEFVLGMTFGLFHLRQELRIGRAWQPVAILTFTGLVMMRGFPVRLPPLLLDQFLLVPVYVALIASSAAAPVGSWVSGRGWQLLGEASYALYILHVPTFWWSRIAFQHLGLPVTSPLLIPVFLAIAIAASVAAYLWVELPARRWIARRMQGVSPQAPPANAVDVPT